MTVRAAWGRFIDLPHMWNFLGFDRGTPFGTELTTNNGTFDEPWVNTPGGNPFPIVAHPDMTFPLYGGFVSFPLDMKPPYADQWNVSVQRQIGSATVVSANYLSSRGHRLPVGDQLQPRGVQPGRHHGDHESASHAVAREPGRGPLLRSDRRRRADRAPPSTTRCCCRRSTDRRTASSFPRSGRFPNCVSDVVNYEPSVAGIELTKPGDPAFDRGSCGPTDQRHVVNLSTVYQVPGTANGVLGALTRDWQVSAIVAARSGTHFAATTGVDNALNGQANQRPNLVGDDPYLRDGISLAEPGGLQRAGAGHLRQSREQQPRRTAPVQRRHGTHAFVPSGRRASGAVPGRGLQRVQPCAVEQPGVGAEQSELRSDHVGGGSAYYSARAEVHVLIRRQQPSQGVEKFTE